MTVEQAVTLIAAVGAFIVSITGAFISIYNATHIAQVHTLVNSMAARTESLQRALGRAEGFTVADALTPVPGPEAVAPGPTPP